MVTTKLGLEPREGVPHMTDDKFAEGMDAVLSVRWGHFCQACGLPNGRPKSLEEAKLVGKQLREVLGSADRLSEIKEGIVHISRHISFVTSSEKDQKHAKALIATAFNKPTPEMTSHPDFAEVRTSLKAAVA